MQNCYLNLSHMELEGNYYNKHLHGFKSDWINIFSAVPQGSIFGPLISVCDLLDVIYICLLMTPSFITLLHLDLSQTAICYSKI